jgi:SNF2 family DNA or RNA helicase
MLSIFMIRRTLKDMILGRPIVELPLTHPATKFINFSDEEKALYRVFENSNRKQLNLELSEGTAAQNYTHWMVRLLRLRQFTAHPFLLEKTFKEDFTVSSMRHTPDDQY